MSSTSTARPPASTAPNLPRLPTGPRDPTRPNGWPAWAPLVVLAAATLVVASELTMAALALPLIGADLGVSTAATAWVLLAYSLPMAALAIPAGRWVDGADVRWVFCVSLAAVAAGSVVSAVAPTFALLLVGRVVQGAASAVYLAVYMPIVQRTVAPDRRGRAISLVGAVMMVGSVAITPVGGLVASAAGWRAVLLVKLPLIAVVVVVGGRVLAGLGTTPGAPRLPRPDRALARDVVLVGTGVTAALLGLEQVDQRWPLTLALLAVAIILVTTWARSTAARPVVDLLRRPGVGLPTLALATTSAVIGLVVFTLPYFVDEVVGRPPEFLAGAVTCFVAVAALAAPAAGWVADRIGALKVAVTGAAAMMAAVLTLASLPPDAAFVDLAWRMGLFGAAMAIFNSPTLTAILAATPEGAAGTVGGLTGLARTLGSVAGPAIAALTWNAGGGGTAGLRLGVFVLAGAVGIGFVALALANWSARTR